ncbi:uncharacterized protein [Venturia canescens]|uniref:uncharacterized protein n=1 Tax=Venturia canescens TaxID=32260 RepID=UPI001C9D543F|nr:uncharacterized protein LOC122415245 [Venturia canescens]
MFVERSKVESVLFVPVLEDHLSFGVPSSGWCECNGKGNIWYRFNMSEAQEIDSPIAKSEEKFGNTDCTRNPDINEIEKSSSTEEKTESRKSESSEEPRNGEETKEKDSSVPNDDGAASRTPVKNCAAPKRDESAIVEPVVIDEQPPASPTSNALDRNKAGECNLLPVLVERLRSALEQSCSSQNSSNSASEERSIPPEDSSVDSEEDLRVWASGLCSSMQQPSQQLSDLESPRGLKLDLKFLEDLLLSDIQTALGRLQETLMRVDIGTLTRYSSTLDPTNKLNLLKLISSLLANLKIPEESIAAPDKSTKNTASPPRRRRTDRHTIGVSSEELARARKWLEDKNASPAPVVEPISDLNPSSPADIDTRRNLDNNDTRDKCENVATKGNPMERLVDPQCQQFVDKVPEKYMKDALNQQQSLQNRSGKDVTREIVYPEGSGIANSGPKLSEGNYKDDNTIINEEFGISASSLYHQGNGQAKCNKFMAKKSKIKRANTIDIPNYLKLQAESLASGHGGVGGSLRRPINIGDRYSCNTGNVVPSFEPKTENDRKFLALINKNNEAAALPANSSLPFKSFNYRQIAAVADKNWNSRFSNIKTTFDKPRVNGQDENPVPPGTNVVVGSLRLPCKQKPLGFSHAPTSPFRKIEKPSKDEMTPGFLKPGYLSQNGSTLRAKVKMFDQENVDSSIPSTNSPLPSTKTRAKQQQLSTKRTPNVFLEGEQDRKINDASERSRLSENGHLNYHSFCKQFAPFATKNPSENHKSGPWSNGVGKASRNPHFEKPREKFEPREGKVSLKFPEEKRREPKVPATYQTSDFGEAHSERKEKVRHRKQLYGNCEDLANENGTKKPREIVAYPFEINYHKRPTFGKKYREATSEKGDYEDPEIQQHPPPSVPPFSTLQYTKSGLQSRKTPSPPPRNIFSTQSVAVQTHQTEPVPSIYPSEPRPNFAPREEAIQRRAVPPPPPPPVPNPMDHCPLYQSRNLSNEETRKREDESRTLSASRQYPNDVYQRSSSQRDTDLPQFVAHRPNYGIQGRPTPPQSVTAPSHVSHPTSHYPPSVDYKSPYYPNVEQHETTYPLESNFGKSAPPQVPARANQAPRKQSIPSVLKNQQEDRYDKYEDRPCENEPKHDDSQSYSDYSDKIFYRDTQNPIYVPPSPRNMTERERFNEEASIDPTLDSIKPEEPKSFGDEIESADIAEDRSFIEDENIENQDISSTEGVVTRYTCAIATVSPVPESPALSPQPTSPKEILEDLASLRNFEESLPVNRRPKENEASFPAFYRDEESALDQARRHNLLQQNLIRQIQGEQSGVANMARRLSQETPHNPTTPSNLYYPAKQYMEQAPIPNVPRSAVSQEKLYGDEPGTASLRYPLKSTEDDRSRNVPRNILSQEKLYRDEPSCGNLRYPVKMLEDEQHRKAPRNLLSQEKLYKDESTFGNLKYPLKMSEDEHHRNFPRNVSSQEKLYRDEPTSGSLRFPLKLQEEVQNQSVEPIIESNNTQDKINIFEERNSSMKKHLHQFKPLSIPRADKEPFVPPKINVVSPSKVFTPSFKGDGDSRRTIGAKSSQRVASSGVDSSDEYLMSCASKPSRSIVLSKSESWHQLAMAKNTLQVPQAQPCALLKPPKPKSPSSLKLSKQYEASSSSDAIRKMEEKIQRYFQGPSSTGQAPDSPLAARRDPKNKRFSSRKSQGSLMRSQTMPHIFDDATDVEKAFDSLFKEATRSDNRY